MLNYNIKISDALANSRTLILLYINQKFICTLSKDNKTIAGKITCNSNPAIIMLKNKIIEDDKKEHLIFYKSPLKFIVTGLVSYFVSGWYVSEPIECPYEYQDNISVNIKGMNPEISINIYKQDIFIEEIDCHADRTTECVIDYESLDEIYKEKKKALVYFTTFTAGLFILMAGIFMLSKQYVPLIVSILIIIMITVVFLYYQFVLAKQYLKLYQSASSKINQ